MSTSSHSGAKCSYKFLSFMSGFATLLSYLLSMEINSDGDLVCTVCMYVCVSMLLWLHSPRSGHHEHCHGNR